jgi:hypothetical protein
MSSYYLTNRSKYILFVVSLLSLIAILGFFFYIFPDNLCFQIYLSGLGLLGAYNIIQKIRNEHIVVSEKGIEYFAPGVIFETAWKNIERISKYWHNGFRQDCFLIDSSQIRMKKWSFFLGRNLPMPFGFTLQKTLIPLSGFSENWSDSELGQQIKQYAPHLFEKEKSMQSA